MQVLHVCSEMFPLLKTGGLADVIGALPAAQIADGVDARVLLPAFPDIRRGVTDAQVVSRRDTFAGHITLLFGHYNGVGIYLIDAPHLYDRPGKPVSRYQLICLYRQRIAFCAAGVGWAEMASGLDPFWRPDVVHAHDWHAGLAPAYLAARGRPAKSVFTVHNLAYQGMFYAHHMNDIQLPWSFFNIHGLEFNGQISFLKAGLYYADHITAVSPTYAREITEPQFAYGMEGLLQQRHREGRLSGVLNGVDEKIWSAETDLLLASRYTRDTLEDKRKISASYKSQWGLRLTMKCRFLQW
ncbi:glycogen/starch synthase [Escherichia coli]